MVIPTISDLHSLPSYVFSSSLASPIHSPVCHQALSCQYDLQTHRLWVHLPHIKVKLYHTILLRSRFHIEFCVSRRFEYWSLSGCGIHRSREICQFGGWPPMWVWLQVRIQRLVVFKYFHIFLLLRYVDHKVCVPKYEEKCTPKLETKCTTKNKEECKEVYKDQCKINYKGQSWIIWCLKYSINIYAGTCYNSRRLF